MQFSHVSVMLKETVDLLNVREGGIYVDGLHKAVGAWRDGQVGVALVQSVDEHDGPLVDHRQVQETGLRGQGLRRSEAAVLVLAVGQVFLVAARHVEGGGQQVKRQVEVGAVDGEEHPLPVDLRGVGLYVFYRGGEQQVGALDEEPVADAARAVAEFGSLAGGEVGLVGGDAEVGPQHVPEDDVQRVAQPVGQSWCVYE